MVTRIMVLVWMEENPAWVPPCLAAVPCWGLRQNVAQRKIKEVVCTCHQRSASDYDDIAANSIVITNHLVPAQMSQKSWLDAYTMSDDPPLHLPELGPGVSRSDTSGPLDSETDTQHQMRSDHACMYAFDMPFGTYDSSYWPCVVGGYTRAASYLALENTSCDHCVYDSFMLECTHGRDVDFEWCKFVLRFTPQTECESGSWLEQSAATDDSKFGKDTVDCVGADPTVVGRMYIALYTTEMTQCTRLYHRCMAVESSVSSSDEMEVQLRT